MPPRPLSQLPTIRIAGIPFAAATFEQAVDGFVEEAAGRSGEVLSVRLANAYCVAVAADDPAYLALFRGPGVTLPDGAPVGWLVGRRARRSGRTAGRVRGPSFFLGVLDRGREAGLRHYVLGSDRSTLDALLAQIELRFPGVRVAGSWAPPYGPLDQAFYDAAEARIAEARPDVVWLGLGTPKQDFAGARLSEHVGVPVVGVGAAFDFFAGSIREAPPWMRDHGLEWLHRLLAEPRRLWRRYLIGNARFALAVVADDVRARRARR